jgi:hypothetical protein
MNFKERYDECHKKFNGLDIGILNIYAYMYVPMICCIYAIVNSFEFLLFIILLFVYYF